MLDPIPVTQLPDRVTTWLAQKGEAAARLDSEARSQPGGQDKLAALKALHRFLFDEGWLAQGWPPEFGGAGGDALVRMAVYEELAARDLPVPATVNSVEVLAPTLRRYAPALARTYLPALIRGTEAWCQGFSEPEAGSDLAALRLRAARDGEEWVLDGQKIWSTRAPGADRCVVLARTGAAEARHRGLSLFLVDMDTPGVTCRPIVDMTGTEHFGEIFFDGVRVRAERVIGEVDKGWQAAMYLFQWERGVFGWLRQASLHAELRTIDPGSDPAALAAWGTAYQDVSTLRLRSLATIRALEHGTSSGPHVSIDKLLLSRAERSVHDMADRMAPVAIDDGSAGWPTRAHDILHARSAPIYGGSAEVQRTIVASHVLGLPRGAR